MFIGNSKASEFVRLMEQLLDIEEQEYTINMGPQHPSTHGVLRLVLTIARDQTARLWDALSGQPVTPPWRHDGAITQATFSRNSRRVLTASLDGHARLWDLTLENRSLADLTLLTQVMHGRKLDPSGGFVPMEPEELQKALDELRTRPTAQP